MRVCSPGRVLAACIHVPPAWHACHGGLDSCTTLLMAASMSWCAAQGVVWDARRAWRLNAYCVLVNATPVLRLLLNTRDLCGFKLTRTLAGHFTQPYGCVPYAMPQCTDASRLCPRGRHFV
jgi:hypothetical protein